jgi:AraC-like DNA-binding protein
LHERKALFESPGIAVVDFRCREHGRVDGPEEPNPTHSIALVRRGLFRRTERGRALVADANHILFFNAAQLYRFSHPVSGGDDCTILTVATPLALEVVGRHAPRDAERLERPFFLGHALSSLRSVRLHYELLNLLRLPPCELGIEDLLAELMDESVRAAYATHERRTERESHSPAVQRRRRELVEAAKLIINRQIESPPSLQALARDLGCSPFSLSRNFHNVAGLSLRRYLGRLRATIAAHHLVRGAADLTELALRLGYHDHSHFTNAFRDEWGVPPSQFRRRFWYAGGRTGR